MISTEYVRLMATYSCWQNQSLYAAAASLTDEARRQDRGAFFRSIHETLDHLLWGDRVWLHRLAGTPAPYAPDIASSTSEHRQWEDLEAARREADDVMLGWSQRLAATDLDGELTWYSGSRGGNITRPRWALVVQLFNHGTHHRGQVHAMLTAAGAAPEDTDVQYLDSPLFRWG